MRVKDLAELMGKSTFEVEQMLKSSDVIDLNLSERNSKRYREDDSFKIFD